MTNIQKKYFALSILLLLGTIWGTGYSLARFATTHGVPPLGYSFWQAIGPAAFITLLALIKNKGIPLSAKHVRFYLICGLTGIVIPNSTMYYASPHLPAGILAMIVNTVPIIAYPLALAFNLESFSWQRLLGIFLAVLGLAFIILPPVSAPKTDHTYWILTTLIAPLSFAICSIFIASSTPKKCDILSQSAGMLVSATLLLTPLVYKGGHYYPFHYPLQTADWVILLEILLSSIGYILFFYLIQIAGPVFYSLVDTIVVLTGVFWGIVIFNEKIHSLTIIAIILIISALLLVTQHQKRVRIAE